jgi:hypothetical protein
MPVVQAIDMLRILVSRALPSEGRGQGFESLRARQEIRHLANLSSHIFAYEPRTWVSFPCGIRGVVFSVLPSFHPSPEITHEQG